MINFSYMVSYTCIIIRLADWSTDCSAGGTLAIGLHTNQEHCSEQSTLYYCAVIVFLPAEVINSF